ncbi:hypothetical protein FQA39_LY09336 [Lamprigera yunnana]|nr:hypothetical protein FQA39_LY09336 [Lamprigera yunnana]
MADNDLPKSVKEEEPTKCRKKKKKINIDKSESNPKKRKLSKSPEAGASSQRSKKNESKTAAKVMKHSKRHANVEEKEESDSTPDTSSVFDGQFGVMAEEASDPFKWEMFHYNFHFTVIDEICLEGLDGITLEALWTRLSVTLQHPLPFPTNAMNFFWNSITSKQSIKFFELEQPRPSLVIFDRYKDRDPDLGEILDPVTAPLDIYPISIVKDNDVLGSASSFNTRTDISDEVRQLPLNEVELKYGSKLVLVASQKLRKKAIMHCLTDPLIDYTPIQYCLLERVARSRYLGEITQGKISLQTITKDPKVLYYNRKTLSENNLITKQPFYIKTSTGTNLSGGLLHICRFYKTQKTKTMTMTQQIVDCLRQKPFLRMEYQDVKKTFGHSNALKKLFKLPEFQRFVRTDVPRLCRDLYPNNSEKWLCARSNKEKVLRTMELIDPNVNVSGMWYEDEPKDESSDDETSQELMFKVPILHQVYDFIRQAGQEGRSLKEIQSNKGLDFYSIRAAVNQLLNQKLISGVKIDMGRQRMMRYQSTESEYCNLEYTNSDSQQEKDQLQLEALDFLSNLLEVDPTYLTEPSQEEISTTVDKEDKFAHIKKLRKSNKQNVESVTELMDIYKNQHGYTEEKNVLNDYTFTESISQKVCEEIFNTSNHTDNNQFKKKKLCMLHQKLKQANECDNLYVNKILKVKCPLGYQTLMCEETYRRVLKNVQKISRLLLATCRYKLKQLSPKMRYMLKQQISLKEMQALTDVHPFDVDVGIGSSTTNVKQRQEEIEGVKNFQEGEEEEKFAKEIYMGPNPTLAYETVDSDGISVAMWVSSKPEEFTDAHLPYIKDNNATVRTVKRANCILDAVRQELVVTDIYRLHKVVQKQDREEGYNVKADRKSFQRIYVRLVRKGLIKILQIVLKYLKLKRIVTVLCDPSLDVHHSVIESVIEQLKMKFFVPKKKVIQAECKANVPSEEKQFETSQISGSAGELKKLVEDDFEYSYSRYIGKDYGHQPKFIRMRVLHEFLFYLIYYYSPSKEVIDGKELFQKLNISMDDDEMKEVPTIYCKELSWKMFVPPLTHHPGWTEGWALLCDVLLRLPLSIFVRVCNVTLVIPGLPVYLEHPVKQHYLVKHLPSRVRSGLMHARKYIFTVHETLRRLAYIGLLQFGPQKLREKDQVFIYLNKNTSLCDTTTTSVGYHHVEEKEYNKIRYHFLTSTDVETYWNEMWNICTHSKLGVRNSVVGTYITIEQLEMKPAMIDALKPQTLETASINDNGEVPGDKKGAAGLDSALWSHVKRNWTMNLTSRRPSHHRLRNVKFKRKLKRSKKEKLKNTKSQQLVLRKKKHSKIVRKVKERVETKKRKGYDVIDKQLMENLKQGRLEWNNDEDFILNVCKLVSTFLCPNFRKQIVSYTAIRDTLHKLLPGSNNKTSGSCQRRLVVLFGTAEHQEYLQQIVKTLTCIPYVKKYFETFYNHVQSGMFLKEKQLHGAFVFLVTYFFKNQHEINHIFEAIDNRYQYEFKTCSPISDEKRTDSKQENIAIVSRKKQNYESGSTLDVLTYDCLEQINRSTKTLKLYPDVSIFPKSEDDIVVDTIKSIIHSTVADRPDDISCLYQLFRVYQSYSDNMLKQAVNEVRNSQMIIAKRHYNKRQNEMRGLPITSKMFHFSFYYGVTQVTKFPVQLFLEAHEILLGINTHKDKLMESSINGLPTDCFQQGHVIGLSEIVSRIKAHFIVNFPNEVLILNPRIADHTELIRELAIRYKKMLTLIKEGSYFKDDHHVEGTEKGYSRAPMIQRFLKSWFLPADNNDSTENDIDNCDLKMDLVCDPRNEMNKKPEKRTKRTVRMSNLESQQILRCFNEEIHQQHTQSVNTQNRQEKLKTVHENAIESFEDYEKKLENLLSSKSVEHEEMVAGPSSKKDEKLEQSVETNVFEKYLLKKNEAPTNTTSDINVLQAQEVEEINLSEVVESTESDAVNNARMEYLMNDELSVEQIMKEMLEDCPSEERRIPNPINLSRLLVKGIFPEMDEDEERLEKLQQHFLVVCPDTNLKLNNFDEDADLIYLYSDHPLVCKNLLRKVQKDIIANDNYPSDQEIMEKFRNLNLDISVVNSIIDFISRKTTLGASIKDIKKNFTSLSTTNLSRFLIILTEMNVIIRTGILYPVFVHYKYRKPWIVESCTLEHQDKMKLEEKKTEDKSNVDLPTLARSLDSYTEIKLHIKPWARIDGSLNLKLFEKWLCVILGFCLSNISVPLKTVINSCLFLRPFDVYYLVECLQEIGCLQMIIYKSEKCGLYTKSYYEEAVAANIMDEIEDIYVEIDKMAIVKFGTILNKKLKEFDFPTDDSQIHGTF